MFNSTDHGLVTGFDKHSELPGMRHRGFDLGDYTVVQEIPVFRNPRPTGYDRALQALRDVRHMLPAKGVAIVDAVLDGSG